MTKRTDLRAEVMPVPPEPPRKPTGSKQQVGRITITLENGQTKNLRVYWYGEEVTPQGVREPPNIEAIRELARALFEKMKQNPDIKNPIQTEVEVEYLNDRNFELLSAKFVPKEGSPAAETLPGITQGERKPEEKVPAQMPTFMVVERLVREILSSPGMLTWNREGDSDLRAVVTPLTPEEEAAEKVEEDTRRISFEAKIRETSEIPTTKEIMSETDIKEIIKKYKGKYRKHLRTLLTAASIPSEVQRCIEGLTHHIEQNSKVRKIKMSRFQALFPTDIDPILQIAQQYATDGSSLETAINKLQNFLDISRGIKTITTKEGEEESVVTNPRAMDQIFESPQSYQTFVNTLTNLLNTLESEVRSINTSKPPNSEQIPILLGRFTTAKSNLKAQTTHYAQFEKNWRKLLREHLVLPLWNRLSEHSDDERFSIEEALGASEQTTEAKREQNLKDSLIYYFERTLGFFPHL